MKTLRFWAAMLLLAPPVALLTGCGGGGSGGDGSVSPTPAPTTGPPPVGARVLIVQLRDRANQPVDGVVSIGNRPVAGTSILATSGGSATFNRNVPGGNLTVSADVDGTTTIGAATVRSSGTTFYTLSIATSVTPAPTATLPPPPF